MQPLIQLELILIVFGELGRIYYVWVKETFGQ